MKWNWNVTCRIGLVLLLVLYEAHGIGTFELGLRAKEPQRSFDTKKMPAGEGPFLDSRIYRHRSKRDPIPLGGGIGTIGTYYADIRVANQTFRVVVDTGSSVLYIPSTDCTLVGGPDAGAACFTVNPPLDVTTADVDPIACTADGCVCTPAGQCGLSTVYGDGSFVFANGYTGPVLIGNLSASNASFGAMNASSDDFVNDRDTALDGLWGLGYQRYPNDILVTIPPVLFTIWEENPSVDRIFSIELNETGGSLLIGGIEERFVREPIRWTELIAHGWYVVNNPRLGVGKTLSEVEDLDVDPGEVTTIVDSGATLIVLPSSYWDALRNGMQDKIGCDVQYMCGSRSVFESTRYCYTDFPFADFPDIVFFLPETNSSTGSDSIPLVLSPEQYMITSVDTQGRSCVSFGFAESQDDFLILGDTFMVQFYTIFDVANDRIGFSAKLPNESPLSPQAPFVPTGSLTPEVSSSSLLSSFSLPSLFLLAIPLAWVIF